MPRRQSDWDAWFKRRDAKNLARRKARGEKVREPRKAPQSSVFSGLVIPRITGEAPDYSLPKTKSYIRGFADARTKAPTPAERELDQILSRLNGGVLRGRYVREHIISGKWIVDFFFKEIRLAIEVDGSVHDTLSQRELDKRKDADCKRFDITLIRISNGEVFGNQDHLMERLRDGWREAGRRPNRIIGKRSPLPK